MDWQELPAETPATRLMADHLWQGDELMDAVVEGFRRVGVGRGRAMLNLALDQGIEAVSDPHDSLCRLFEQIDTQPSWHDRRRWERGRRRHVDASLAGRLSMGLQDFMGTFVGEEVSTATGVTGRFLRDFVRRERETIAFFYTVSRPGAADRFAPEFKDIVRVRLMHAQARAGLRRSLGDDHYAHHGNPISNSTMVGAAMTFALLPLLYDHIHGRRCKREELDLVVEYWAYIAYIFGVADELIPRNSHEAMVCADYMVAYAGGPTSYTDTFATAAVEAIRNRKGIAGRVANIGIGPALGAMAHFAGPDLVRALVHAPGLDATTFEPWMSITAMLSALDVRSAALTDLFPGRFQLQRLRASRGDPYLALHDWGAASRSRRRRGAEPLYTGHDMTPDTPSGAPLYK